MSINIDFNNRETLEVTLFEQNEDLNWLAPAKTEALNQFKLAKLPSRKVEHWKYNEMFFIQENQFQLNKSIPNDAVLIENTSGIDLDNSIDLTFVDGDLITSLESLSIIDGLTITQFKNTNETQQKTILSQVDPEFNKKNLLVNLNESVLKDGLLIEVNKNQIIEKPIYLRYFSSSKNNHCISSNKVVVTLGQSSEITLIEQFDSDTQATEQLSLQQTSIELSENSQFNHYRLNLEFETAKQASQVKTKLGKNAVLNSFYLGLGSQLNRTDIDVLHVGSNAEANINGIYLPANSQAIDYHTNIQHQVPHCNSNEVFRGIIADQSSATFNGKIHIFRDAQKSDAYLNNKNLLLTNQATINTKPELEIYADDVVCAHGATVAQLNDEAMFYMQTRGLSKLQAKKMLSIAFVQELLNQIKLEPIKKFLSDVLERHMTNLD